MNFTWPNGVARVPDEPWATAPLESLALKYDTVEGHGWYRNLDRTVEQLLGAVRPGDLVIDYSGGTGILVARLLEAAPSLDAGFLVVDASPKFLRLAVEKLGGDPRVAFRWMRYRKDERRLDLLDEALDASVLDRRADVLVSTNAIHLYYGLPDTLGSWARVLKPGGRAFVQSGNIRNPACGEGEWIIDETVGAIHETAKQIVREDDRYTAHRAGLADAGRMAKYDALRAKYFLPVRPLDHYTGALEGAGFAVEAVETRTIPAVVDEWYDFLAVYHEGVLGWFGGAEKIEGAAPAPPILAERKALIRAAMDRLFGGATSFSACWTYLSART